MGSTSESGGGLATGSPSTTTITNCIFSGNRAAFEGGAIASGGEMTVINSTFEDNRATGDGGAIHNGFNQTLTVVRSTFSRNSAAGGGAISSNGARTIILNSTFAGNSSTDFGGAIRNGGPLMVINSTIAGNSARLAAGGIENLSLIGAPDTAALVVLRNTLLADNDGGNCLFHPVRAPITDGGNNLADDSSCNLSVGNNIDPMLDPAGLKNNGGPTETIELQPRSPAIDAVAADCVDNNGNLLDTDQRGFVRAVPRGGTGIARCDIGAFEFHSGPECYGLAARNIRYRRRTIFLSAQTART